MTVSSATTTDLETRREADRALAVRSAAGDPAAQRELLERLVERVRTTVRYLAGDHRDQDDWVQLALLEVLRSIGGYRGESSLEGWTDRVVVRTAMRQLKQRRRRDGVVSLVEDLPEVAGLDRSLAPDRIALRRRMAQLLGAIGVERRTAIVLKLVHGYSVEEVAEITGVPANTVRDRLRLGRKQLREKMERDPVIGPGIREGWS